MSDWGLPGRLVVVTGAARGQGAAICAALATEGADVVATDLDAQRPGDLPASVRYQRLDVASASDWAELAVSLGSAPVHGLVNNAGITWRARLLEVSPIDMARVFDVNVCGALLGIQALAGAMVPGSSIVNVGSVAGLTGHYPVAYTASKWALRGMTKAAATELGPAGIRVNLVHPGYIETAMTASASAVFRASNVAETPLGRTGQAHEVASVVVFLLGAGSQYVSGAEIPVDGGFSAHGGVKSVSDAMRAGV